MPNFKPLVFISYSHKDEPEHPRDGETQWLSLVLDQLKQLEKVDLVEIFVDRKLHGGADWRAQTQAKLQACDIFLLLVSANSMSSDEVVDKEIAIIERRLERSEKVLFYPLLITPVAEAALDRIRDKNIRPRDLRPLSGMSPSDRMVHMTEVANDFTKIAREMTPHGPSMSPGPKAHRVRIDITGLPETAYERLVGRDDELKRLDDAWSDQRKNILSLVAEGGAGKSALVNEWLKRMQAADYGGAETVLGWSFYSQGTKERATSADGFLNWAVEKLGVAVKMQNATAKGEAIAEALMNRRVLLVLDGVEPLQFGPEGELGRLKDNGLSLLLRRFAATPPGQTHGMILLTSRLALKDIGKWKDGAAPLINVDTLSDDAGAELLRDNGVQGIDRELRQASHEFGGHPLALGLLASFLKETQNGDVRRRDHIRALLDDTKNPGHDHAARVMESYEREWLVKEPVPHAIMLIMGLFDRPADSGCLAALRREPVIAGLTDHIVNLDDAAWAHAIARLRDVRLLAPTDPSKPDAIDAHALVRDWFGERFKSTNLEAWNTAHGRLYEHLRDTTKESDKPSLEQLTPLYQAIAHGCRAGRHQEALDDVYTNRICRRLDDGRIQFYSWHVLGATGSNLAVLTNFFEKPFSTPIKEISTTDQYWVLGEAAQSLGAQGRLTEALQATRRAFQFDKQTKNWINASVSSNNFGMLELLSGEIANALSIAAESVDLADRSESAHSIWVNRAFYAHCLHGSGNREAAKKMFDEADELRAKHYPKSPWMYPMGGYYMCDYFLENNNYLAANDYARKTIEIGRRNGWRIQIALDALTLGRASLGLALSKLNSPQSQVENRSDARTARSQMEDGVKGVQGVGSRLHTPCGFFARAIFRRFFGDWFGVERDLDEVEEIAEPGPMKLFLCDLALERARLAFAKIEAFAPLNGMIEDSPPKPQVPGEAERKSQHAEAAKQIDIAAKLIAECGYHRRDAELAELQSVLAGERTFASLPIHV